ncbi:MAG: SdpI family protein [Peptococcaceae bacterium]|nr:SdpI family protein [Peptococcaceae bacterium]
MPDNKEYRWVDILRQDWPLILILLGLLVAAFVVYPQLPERVPMHWNAGGEVDRYGSRFTGAFAIPLLTIGIYIGMLVFPLMDPRRANYANFSTAYRAIRTGLVLFLAVLYGIVTTNALGYEVNVARVVPITLGLLFILIGNFLTQVRHNYFVGIRTPWTLASEEVWRKTHRVGGFAFVLAGIISILAAFLPAPANFWVVIGSLIGAAAITTIYSAIIYFRHKDNVKIK